MSPSEHAEPAAGDVLEAVTAAIAALESHADSAVRDAARALLQGIDAVHRAGLTHLVQGIHGMAGEAFLHRLVADPAIRLLLMSYNLIAVDRRIQAEEAVDAVRGHLHDHGVDVELTEVVGGVVYAHLHVAGSGLEPSAIREDLEAALRAGFLGFQELVFQDRARAQTPAFAIPLKGLRKAHKPVYADAGAADLTPGELRAVTLNNLPILLTAVEGDVYALHNRCGDSPLPLEFSVCEGAVLICSWHGCRYDLRTGRRVDGVDGRIRTYPVALAGARVQVALDVEPAAGER